MEELTGFMTADNNQVRLPNGNCKPNINLDRNLGNVCFVCNFRSEREEREAVQDTVVGRRERAAAHKRFCGIQ